MATWEEKLRAIGEAVRRGGFLMTAHADEEGVAIYEVNNPSTMCYYRDRLPHIEAVAKKEEVRSWKRKP